MGANLYFVSEGSVSAMAEYRYDTEDELQKLIADNPGLLLRDSDKDEARLMLVAREHEIPVNEDSALSYYLDHLMVDQVGVPVLVEVKRSTDTRSKREVVAQMIDYASRVSTWDVGELRERFRENNADSDLIDDYDTDEFWDQVANCLKAERVKLVFVADRIPGTLKTMIEFLDRNLNSIEVYGVELRQFKTNGAMLLSSSIVGEAPLKSKHPASRSSIEWTVNLFADYLQEHDESYLMPVVEKLMSFASELNLTCHPGHGLRVPKFKFKLGVHTIFSIGGWWTKAMSYHCRVEFYIRSYIQYSPGKDWGCDVVQDLFTNIPGHTDAKSKGYIVSTDDHIYIDLRALMDDKNLSYSKTAIKAFCNAIIESEQGMLPTPPQF